ncbi:MAG: CDP-alcohol phosphatidyltransferase family protein [Microthrixaceae bacterium]
MLDGRFRSQVDRSVRPIGASLKRAGIPADAITCIGLVMSVGCALAIAFGRTNLGVLLLAATGIPDTLDGAVAKASGTASPRGAFFDSVSDRVTDALLFGGVAWYLADRAGAGRHLTILAFAAFATAVLPSYIRAKAETLGIEARGGLVERAERFVILGLGLLFTDLLVAALWLLVALNLLTAGQRFAAVWRQAGRPRPVERDPRLRRRRRAAAPRRAGTAGGAGRFNGRGGSRP